METELDKTLALLKAEILRARKKHPGNLMLVEALSEEIGEALDKYDPLFPELILTGDHEWLQVACVAIRLRDEGTLLTPASCVICDRLVEIGEEANAILKASGVPD